MPYSHKCPICEEKISKESADELMTEVENHLLNHLIETRFEEEHLKEFGQDSFRTISEPSTGEVGFNTETLEDADTEDTMENTGMEITENELSDYSEQESYGEERYILDSYSDEEDM